jgi:hypothetical protein
MTFLGIKKKTLFLSDMTQNQALLAYMKRHPKGVTTWQAFEIGITCLWKRISELEALGHKIERTDVHGVNRYGNPCKVVRYRLTEAKNA